MPRDGEMSWKIAFVLSVALAIPALQVSGCSNDACDRADQEIEACSTQNVTPPSTALECTEKRVCQAGCIDQATCAEINAAFCIGQTLCPPEPSTTPFAMCMAACEGM
jgi:hypothetical protein